MAAKDDPVVWFGRGRGGRRTGLKWEWQNIKEAECYTDKINNIFDHLSVLIHQDTKTALSQTIQNFKKIVTWQWESMGDTDVDVVLRLIKDPTALYLRQHLTARGIEVVDPPKELPSGQEFLRQLPERAQAGWGRWPSLSNIFNHAAQAHDHLLKVCANVTALAKITDKTTLMSVINGAVRLLVQINIPEGFLNPLEDKKVKTTEEEKEGKSSKDGAARPWHHLFWSTSQEMVRPASSQLRVWLKMSRKYFNEGTAKEACELFNVRAKQLSRVLTGKKYLGGTQARRCRGHWQTTSQMKERRFKQWHTTTLLYVIPFMHTAENHCKVRPCTNHHFISFITSQFPV